MENQSTALRMHIRTVKSTDTPLEAYTRLIQNGTLRPDPKQLAAVHQLQRLHTDLKASHEQQSSQGWFNNLFGKYASQVSSLIGLPVHMH
jgi:predicted ATPase